MQIKEFTKAEQLKIIQDLNKKEKNTRGRISDKAMNIWEYLLKD